MHSGSAPPPPWGAVTWAFRHYLRALAARHFAAVHWHRGPASDGPDAAHSTLFVANHTNWWDGFLACLVCARLGLHFRILMDTANLDRYWMFRWVGALSLTRDRAVSAYEDLKTAIALLERPGTGLWIFPQGDRRPPEEPITGTRRGAAHLALSTRGPLTILPVAFRYAHLGEQLPEAFVWLGKPWTSGSTATASVAGSALGTRRRALTREIEAALQATVDALDLRVDREELDEFETLLPGRLSINKRLDRMRHSLGTIHGPFERRNG